MKSYLSVCAIYRNEARYLPEWLEFHRLLGVERFFLFNNRSEDDHLEVLAPYISEGTVEWHDWPLFPGQMQCYWKCIEDHRADARWIAFFDLDEFLFSPTGRLLSEVLHDFEAHPGVVVNCIFYGTSGHETPPQGLQIENYTRRIRFDAPRNLIVKTIADPARTIRVGRTPHYFRYADRAPSVDEQFREARRDRTPEVSVDLLRINHYFTRSQQERDAKIARPRAHSGELMKKQAGVEERDSWLNAEVDEILVPYGRAVRTALAARESGSPLPPGALHTALAQASSD